jgi:hypothetical protein
VGRLPLPLSGVPFGTLELAGLLGIGEMKLRRMADALGFDKHPGPGARVWYSPEEQTAVRRALTLMRAGYTLPAACELADAIPPHWSSGWALIDVVARTVQHLVVLNELPAKVGDLTVLVRLGGGWIEDVATGGRL